MRTPIPLTVAFEDALHEALILKILGSFYGKYEVHRTYNEHGDSQLKRKIAAFNHAARRIPYLVLTDLDRVPCPPQKISDWLPQGAAPNMLFRIAVREAEAWVLAHRTAVAELLGTQPNKIPGDVDQIADPKQFLINLARKSRKKLIRSGIPPKPSSTSSIGRDYNTILTHFVLKTWDPDVARVSSGSLRRMMDALDRFVPTSTIDQA